MTQAPPMPIDVAHVELAGERLELRPDASMHWPSARTTFIADLHLGKAATFRRFGIPVPERSTTVDIARLDALVETLAPERVVILGDLFHAKLGRTPPIMGALHDWRTRHAQLDILLIRGNHDRSAGDPPDSLDMTIADAPCGMAPFSLHHEPPKPDHMPGQARHATPIPSRDDRHALAAHIHPAVRIKDRAARTSIKLPCFHVSPTRTLLPAFGSFTGTKIVPLEGADRAYAIADGSIIEIKKPLTV